MQTFRLFGLLLCLLGSSNLLADAIPTPAIVFPDSLPSERNVLVRSAFVFVLGIDEPSPISISGGEYRVGTAGIFTPFTSSPGFVLVGQTLELRLMSAPTYLTETIATLTVGGQVSTFSSTTKGDNDPDIPLPVFTEVTDSVRNQFHESNTIQITGLLVPAPVYAIGASYRIGAGPGLDPLPTDPWRSDVGFIENNERVQLRARAAGVFDFTSESTLIITNASTKFEITTENDFIALPIFQFAPVNNAELNTEYDSQIATVLDISTGIDISVSGGEMSINGGPFFSGSDTIFNNQTIQLRALSAPTIDTTTTVVLNIGDPGTNTFYNWDINTRPDLTPDPFTFTPVLDATRQTPFLSDVVTINGISAPARVEVLNGSFSIASDPFSSVARNIEDGESLQIRAFSSGSFDTTMEATAIVGTATEKFTITTEADFIALPLAPFLSIEDAELNTDYDSVERTITDITTSIPISVTGGLMSIDGGPFVAGASTISNNQTIQLRGTSSGAHAANTTVTLTVGGGALGESTYDFEINTVPDYDPNTFTYAPQFNQIRQSYYITPSETISGLGAPAEVSVITGAYRINGGSFTSVTGTIQNGDVLEVRIQAAGVFDTTTQATVSVGNYSTDIEVTTEADFIHDPLGPFFSINEALLNTEYDSFEATITGLTTSIPISVTGGLMSIDDGPFIAGASTISNNQTVRLRGVSSLIHEGVTTVSLQVGNRLIGTIGEGNRTYTFIITASPDYTPNAFTFTPETDAFRGEFYISDTVTIGGLGAGISARVMVPDGASYSINGASFTTVTTGILGGIANGDQLRIGVNASEAFDTLKEVTIVVGSDDYSYSTTFSVTTELDFIHDPMAPFLVVNDALLDTDFFSEVRTVTGIATSIPVIVTNGFMSIDGGAFITGASTISNNQTIQLRGRSSVNHAEITTVSLQVGDRNIFTLGEGDRVYDYVINSSPDYTPDAFTLTPQIDAFRGEFYISDTVTLSGLGTGVSARVMVPDGASYSINGAAFTTFTTGILGGIANGDQLRIGVNASEAFDTLKEVTIVVGSDDYSYSTTFSVTTELDFIHDPLAPFLPLNEVLLDTDFDSVVRTVTGIATPIPVIVTNGFMSIDGGAFIAGASTISNNQTIQLRGRSSVNHAEITTVSLQVGDRNIFTLGEGDRVYDFVIDSSPDYIPDDFFFTELEDGSLLVDLPRNADYISEEIEIQGLGPDRFGNPVEAEIRVFNGSYSINGGPFTSVTSGVAGGISGGGVMNGDMVRLKGAAAASSPDDTTVGYDTLTIVELRIGSDDYNYGTTFEFRTEPDKYVNDYPEWTLLNIPDPSQVVAPSQVVLTNKQTMTGFAVPIPIRISDGEYSINGGAFTSAEGLINNDDSIQLRATASPDYLGIADTVLTIGYLDGNTVVTDISGITVTGVTVTEDPSIKTFRVNTVDDVYPDPFTFNEPFSIPAGAYEDSDAVIITGMSDTAEASISIKGRPEVVGYSQYRINGGAYTSSVGIVRNGDSVQIRRRASDFLTGSPSTSATLTIGYKAIDPSNDFYDLLIEPNQSGTFTVNSFVNPATIRDPISSNSRGQVSAAATDSGGGSSGSWIYLNFLALFVWMSRSSLLRGKNIFE